MNKNNKKLFIITTLVFLLVGLNTITANEINENQTTNIQEKTTQEINTEITTNTQKQHNHQQENKKKIHKTKQNTKQDTPKITTNLEIKFQNNPEDEIYKTTHINEEYIIDISLTKDPDQTPLPATIQLYLQEDTQPLNITLNQSGQTQQKYTAQTPGTYEIHAEYQGNNEYENTISNTLILSIEQYTPTITTNTIENTCYNSTITINGTLTLEDTPMINKNIELSFNNNHITTLKTDTHGQFTYTLNLENVPIQNKALILLEYTSDNITHTDAYQETSFDIEKIKNNIQTNKIENTIVLNNININGKVTSENNKTYTQTLTAIITNTDTNTQVYNNTISIPRGTYSINYTPITSGNYTVKLITPEDEYYLNSTNHTEFTVEKATPTLILEDAYHITVQENISITGKLITEYQKPLTHTNITISTQNQTITTLTTDENGMFNFTNYIFNESIEDEYLKIYFDVTNNTNCNNIHNETKLYINKRNTNITLNTETHIKINGTLHIKGQIKDAKNQSIKPLGTITAYIEDNIIKENIQITNGEYETTINIKENYIGKDKISIKTVFIPENPLVYSTENYAKQTITHQPLNTQLTIQVNNSHVDTKVNISITLEDENKNKLDKTVKITVTDQENNKILDKTLTLNNGKNNISFTPNMEGIYNIITEYAGEPNIYTQTTASKEIIATKTDTKLVTSTPNRSYVNDTIKITGKLVDENNQTITNTKLNILIKSANTNTSDIIQTSATGSYEYEFKPQETQQYNITIIFNGTYKYNQSQSHITITPIKHSTQITITKINTSKYNSTITITGQVLDNENNHTVNGTVTIILNNNIITTIALINGQYKTTHTIKTIQDNKLQIKFNENNVYIQSNKTINFETTPLTTKITANKIPSTEINETITINGRVTDENNKDVDGKVQIYINNQSTIRELKLNNSTYQFTYQTDKMGKNTLNILFTPDTNIYTTTGINTTFNVIRTNLQLSNMEKQADKKDDTITIIGKLVNNNNIPTNNIKVNIICNNKTYTQTTNNDGIFTIKTDRLQPGNYSVLLTVKQTDYFNEYDQDMGNVIIEKKTPVINLDNIENTTYSKQLIITGNLTDTYNRPLTKQNIIIKTDNTEYKTITDDNGKYNITIENFQAGINNLIIIVPETVNTKQSSLNKTFKAEKEDAKIILDLPEQVVPGQTLSIHGKLVNIENQHIPYRTVNITVNNQTFNAVTDAMGRFIKNITNINMGKYDINVIFEDSNYNTIIAHKTINSNKVDVQVSVDNIVARVGENIKFQAKVHDKYGNPVYGGNLVFKLNGRTLRSDGRFDTNNSSVIKFSVKNGLVEYILTADLYLRNGKNITASYSGSYKYNSAKSNIAVANIQLRYASIKVTTNTGKVKHHEIITFTARVKDTTPKSNKNLLNNDAHVFFKINGVTIKDKNGQIIKTKIKNNTSTLKYNITTMAGITKSNTLRNYVVTAVYDTPYYYPVNNKNTTRFNVERSPVNINIREARVNKVLVLRGNLTDYLGYRLVGKSKICIKINGVTYKENNSTKYYTIKNGVINIDNIKVKNVKVKSLEIVTGQRLAYLAARKKISKITS